MCLRPTLTHAAVFVALIAVSGCSRALDVTDRVVREANAPEPRMSGHAQQPADRPVTKSPKTGFARKRVAGKSAPSDLVADDGTRCTVSEDKFQRTEAGDRVWCRWQDPLNPTPTSNSQDSVRNGS